MPRAPPRNKRVPNKKAPKQDATAEMIQTMLKEVELSYNASQGVLEGDGITQQPTSLEVLGSLKRNLEKLSAHFEKSIELDNELIRDLSRKLLYSTKTKQEEHLEEFIKTEPAEEDGHVSEENEVEEEDKQGASEEPSPKKQKLEPERVNPKSEFVPAQTLPAAAFALGLFNETKGEDSDLKKKYAVASYPASDLKDLLPGEIPDADFTDKKPNNQVQFTTFQTFVEGFFRNFSEDDIRFLRTKYNVPSMGRNYDPQVTPFLVPKLGPFYLDVWDKEDSLSRRLGVSERKELLWEDAKRLSHQIGPAGSGADLSEETLDYNNGEIQCGPLASRLLSALLRDDGESACSELVDQQGWNCGVSDADYTELEKRLAREMQHMGVFMNVEQTLKSMNPELADVDEMEDAQISGLDRKGQFHLDFIRSKEDDEVCVEMRNLQSKLRETTTRNGKRKQRLIPLVQNQIEWQEYLFILEDLEKQIDQAYMKRARVPKRSKKKTATSTDPNPLSTSAILNAQQHAANQGLKNLLNKRSRWLSLLEPLFGDFQKMKRIPSQSVFEGINLDEDDEEFEEDYDLVKNL